MSFAFMGNFLSSAMSFFTSDGAVNEIRETADTVTPPPPVASLSASQSFMLSQSDAEDLKEEKLKEVPLPTSFGGTALVNPQMVETLQKPESRTEIVTYVVKEGDSASVIAGKYDLKTSTILWANDLDSGSILKIGQSLLILPVDGIAHTVKAGDTLASISSKWSGDVEKIKRFNGITRDDQLKVDDVIIVPDGVKPAPPPPPAPTPSYSTRGSAYTNNGSVVQITGSNTRSDYNRFPWGWCTWYVASRRNIPWNGNANQWIYNARAMGYATGSTPRVGAVMQSNESWWGHVSYVESVNGDGTITISEMNYVGFGVKSFRTLSVNSGVIVGYIY